VKSKKSAASKHKAATGAKKAQSKKSAPSINKRASSDSNQLALKVAKEPPAANKAPPAAQAKDAEPAMKSAPNNKGASSDSNELALKIAKEPPAAEEPPAVQAKDAEPAMTPGTPKKASPAAGILAEENHRDPHKSPRHCNHKDIFILERNKAYATCFNKKNLKEYVEMEQADGKVGKYFPRACSSCSTKINIGDGTGGYKVSDVRNPLYLCPKCYPFGQKSCLFCLCQSCFYNLNNDNKPPRRAVAMKAKKLF